MMFYWMLNLSWRSDGISGGDFLHVQVCDFVVIARLLNATIVLPKIQGIVSVKGGG